MFIQIGPFQDKDDRAQLVKILATNGYTVRIARYKIGKANRYDYFVEYEKNARASADEA